MDDVGRNDPCPCGSGAKYKYCCLRKKKGGAANDDLSENDGWQRQLARAVNRGYQARRQEGPGKAIDIWLAGWRQIQDQIPAEVSTLNRLEKAVDGDRSMASWLFSCIDLLRNLARQRREVADSGAEFLAQILQKFPGESQNNQHLFRADRGWLLAAAGRWDEATEEFERLIADFPNHAAGYVAWADALIEHDPGDPAKALEILERAADRPVDDGADWDLQVRIEELRQGPEETPDEALEEPQPDGGATENDQEQIRREREAFWDRFMDADFEEKLELGAGVIENKPWFDGEDAFYLFVDQLEGEAGEHDARDRWLELFDLLREHRPDVMNEESVYLGRAALRFVFALQEDQRIDEVVDLLFYDPAGEMDLFINVLPRLMYHDIDGVYPRLKDGWEQIRDSDGLGGWAFSDWADGALWFLIADWAGDDPRRSRDLDDVQEAMGEMFDELDVNPVEKAITGLLGEEAANVDSQSVGDIEHQQDRAVAIGNGFGNYLIAEEDWPPGKAVLAARYMGGFLDYCAGVDDPFSDRYTTDKAKKNKLLNRELKQLRKHWRDGGEFAPHPDLAVGYTQAVLYGGQFGRPCCAAALFEAVTRLAPWMHRRGFIDNADLVDQIQNHLGRRIASLGEEIVNYADSDPGVERGLQEAKRLLNGDG